jgi:hypothetical protein
MPVSIPEVDRQMWSIGGKLLLERCDQLTVLFVDGANAAKQLVVLCDCEHPFARNVLTAQNIFEERNYIVHAFGAAEGDNDQSVVVRR